METIKIQNINIYGIEESKKAATYPMNRGDKNEISLAQPNKELFLKLFNATSGSGHDCAAKGIIIQFDLTAPEYFWRQIDRYHFIDHVSSQSKMHCIKKFDIDKMCNDEVDDVVKENLKKLIEEDAPLRKILSNVPSGFMLTSRMTTNLLQLKTILNQRRYHKLPEWQEFCDWIFKLIDKDLNLVNRYIVFEEEYMGG